MFSLCFLCRMLLILDVVFSLHPMDSPKWIVEKKRQRYAAYEKCMTNRKKKISLFQNSEKYIGFFAINGTDVILPCFSCLDPADEELMEDIWKPDISFIGRKVFKVFDRMKEAILKHARKSSTQPRESYCWQYMKPKAHAWISLLNVTEAHESYEKANKIIKSYFFGEKQRYHIGRHFELEIRQANLLSDVGWYRCLPCSGSNYVVTSAYFLDVLADYRIEMISHSDIGKDSLFSTMLNDYGLETYAKYTQWTKCNKCGENIVGESRRRISCFLRPIQPNLTASKIRALELFEELSCQSLLIPEEIRKQLKGAHKIYEEHKECQAVCPISKNETREVKGREMSEKAMILDRILPGEFLADERLPLLENVRRRVYRVIQNNPLVLDCGVRTEGILWKRNGTDLNSSALLSSQPYAESRVVLTAEGQLIFKRLQLNDDNRYACFTLSKGLVATFRVFVAREEKEAERIVRIVQMGIRFLSFALLVILVIIVMMC